MAWWGKLVGGALGFILGGPLGAALGAAMGHQYDAGAGARQTASGEQERVQLAFFTATFSVMGAVAKADGRVSPKEISMAEALMTQMGLSPTQRRAAIELFNQGKQRGFPLEAAVRQFRQECRRRTTVLQMFLEIQIKAAQADGRIDPAERRVLLRIGEWLGFPRRHVEYLLGGASSQRPSGAQPRATLAQAYATLGVASNTDLAEVKRAYRRLMSQHHPDKLVARGMPEEMVKLATEKTQQIRDAYDRIKAARR